MILKIDEVFRQKGSNTRIEIIKLLLEKPRSAAEISKLMELNYTTVRYHLDLMQRTGIVSSRGNRGAKYYLTRNVELIKGYLIPNQ